MTVGFSQENQSLEKMNADSALVLAQKLAWNANYDLSSKICKLILEEKPFYTDVWLQLGRVYAWDEKYDSARTAVEEIFVYDNHNLDAFLLLADIDNWARDYQNVLETCTAGLKYHPFSEDLLLKRARAYYELGEEFKAKKDLFLILKENPGHKEAASFYEKIETHIRLGELPHISGENIPPSSSLVHIDTLQQGATYLAEIGKYDEALEMTGKILDLRPDYKRARILRARIFAWQDRFNEARNQLLPLNVERTGDMDVLGAWIDIENWSENYERMRLFCDIGLKFHPYHEDYLYHKIEALGKSGNYYLAKRHLLNILEKNKEDSRALDLLHRIQELKNSNNFGTIQSEISENDNKQIEQWYREAREFAANHDYYNCRMLCNKILVINNQYYDALVLKALSYYWDAKYDVARKELEYVLRILYDNKEALLALTDLEIIAENYGKSMGIVDRALLMYPDDEDFLIRKARLYKLQGDDDNAKNQLRRVMQIAPENKHLQSEMMNAIGPLVLNGVSLEHTYNLFDEPYVRRWHMTSFRYYNTNNIGTFIGSLNLGQLVSDTSKYLQNPGLQLELDAYPKFNNGDYAHIYAGFSPNAYFPRYKFGGDWFHGLSNNWEMSLGGAFLRYVSTVGVASNRTFFAGSIGKYLANSWLSLLVQLTPAQNTLATGFNFTWRRYLNISDNWVSLSIGSGRFPEDPSYYVNDPNYSIYEKLSSFNASLGFRYRVTQRSILRFFFTYQNEEYIIDTKRHHYTFNLAYIYTFKN